jgi:hypothetical protein
MWKNRGCLLAALATRARLKGRCAVWTRANREVRWEVAEAVHDERMWKRPNHSTGLFPIIPLITP